MKLLINFENVIDEFPAVESRKVQSRS